MHISLTSYIASLFTSMALLTAEDRCLIKCLRVEKVGILSKWRMNFPCESGTRSSAIAVIADRTACSILTLFIAIATSRPPNKKNPFAGSQRIQQLLQICIRNPHTSAATTVAGHSWVPGLSLPWWCRVSLLTNEPCVFDSLPESVRHLWRFSLRFCGAFWG